MRFLGGFGVRLARRSRWLARRLWLVAALEVALITHRHWRRLDADERRRLTELARKSRGKPSNLSGRERDEAAELLEKLDYAELRRHRRGHAPSLPANPEDGGVRARAAGTGAAPEARSGRDLEG